VKPISGWTNNSVAAETVYILCINTKKPVFNTLCIISNLLDFLVEKLIEIISVKNTKQINRAEFNKVFDAFEAQTKPYKEALGNEFHDYLVNIHNKSLEAVLETKYLEAVGKFLKVTEVEDMKLDGYANKITRHLINLCCESDKACFEMSQYEYLPFVLDMIVKYPKSLEGSRDEKKHSLKVLEPRFSNKKLVCFRSASRFC
jgi:hypothetical protein